ncbi:MAG: undecaprenyldiphospho-muramoylpentapeptide beta-N-acetylglucosaminyltransferase [Vampirovibrionales bacterium]|nr:undecaprenyldiphospho-muramoylpentapeptide beta-N-acetylglucosaminyltransferase [Vampirovibrionales bacterium]
MNPPDSCAGLRIALTGGGTGGHVFPALAVAECLRDDPALAALVYIGKRDGLESRLIPASGFAFEGLDFSGMPRRPGLGFARWLASIPQAVARAGAVLETLKPHVVFATGGYVSAPVLAAALQRRIPYVIHEPDAHPGLVNRLMGRWADQATAAFAQAQRSIPCARFHVTGNPLRGAIGALDQRQGFDRLGLNWDPSRPTLLATGGSQGARRLNLALAGALHTLTGDMGLQILHQTGAKLHDETMAALAATAQRDAGAYCARPFFEEMAAAWACADLVLCRSGSLTLSELYRCGLPSILVPYPHAAADHQSKNAQASAQAGASVVIADDALDAERLIAEIRALLGAPQRLQSMAAASLSLGRPQATDAIVALLKAYSR